MAVVRRIFTNDFGWMIECNSCDWWSIPTSEPLDVILALAWRHRHV